MWLLAGVFAGHSTACLALLAHELSHNAILKRSSLRRMLEVFLWGLNFIPATLWDEVHNRTHHVETNTPRDPDRRWLAEEAGPMQAAYTKVLYPNGTAGKSRRNPLVFVQFLGYISRNILAALSGSDWGTLPATPSYTRRERWRIAGEMIVILMIQTALFWLVGWDVLRYLCVGPLPLLAASAVVMTYVFTNHFLNPIHDHSDPIRGSTSVIVPKCVDWVHLNFSYHTEHHIFPGMSSTHYPALSRAINDLYPEIYNRVSLGTAWRQLWRSDAYGKRAEAMPASSEGRDDS
jgi:fatty acid desaturase